MHQIEIQLNELGRAIKKCMSSCSWPRGLVIESGISKNAPGCVVVGINPGRANKSEKELFGSYNSSGLSTNEIWANYWSENLRDHHTYYVKLRRLVDQLSLKGPILWTELIKCENPLGASRSVDVQRLHICANAYFSKELNMVGAEWTLIAVGRITFNTLAKMFPKQPIVGVPHPTGRHSHVYFDLLFDNNTLRNGVIEQYRQRSESKIWLHFRAE